MKKLKLFQKKYEPLISIIVPIYNSSRYLRKCIESIIGQTYRNLEIILVNDGSTDQSLEIAKYYKNQDSRITIINQKNSGGIIARKNGVAKAMGKYILIEDSDDWLEKDLVEKCVDAVKEHRDADIVKFGYIFEPSGEKKNLLNDKAITNSVLEDAEIDQIFERIIYNTDCNQIWNEMVRKELYDFEDEVFKYIVHKGEDIQINLQIFQKAKKVILLKDNLYHYMNNPNGITKSADARKIINNTKDNIYLNKLRREIALKKYGYVDNIILINKTLSLLSNKIIYLLASSKNPKIELKYIQDELKEDLNNYFRRFSKKDIHQNPLQRRIAINILDNKFEKNLKYRPLCKMLAIMR